MAKKHMVAKIDLRSSLYYLLDSMLGGLSLVSLECLVYYSSWIWKSDIRLALSIAAKLDNLNEKGQLLSKRYDFHYFFYSLSEAENPLLIVKLLALEEELMDRYVANYNGGFGFEPEKQPFSLIDLTIERGHESYSSIDKRLQDIVNTDYINWYLRMYRRMLGSSSSLVRKFFDRIRVNRDRHLFLEVNKPRLDLYFIIDRGAVSVAAAPLSFVNGCVVWQARLLRTPLQSASSAGEGEENSWYDKIRSLWVVEIFAAVMRSVLAARIFSKKNTMEFYTVINCMDGRVQLPVNRYLRKRFNVKYIDTITAAGPNLILSANQNHAAVQSILEKLNISIEKHHSIGIAIVGYHDCAGNTAAQSEQVRHIKEAIQFLQQKYQNIKIIGLWVDENWQVTAGEGEENSWYDKIRSLWVVEIFAAVMRSVLAARIFSKKNTMKFGTVINCMDGRVQLPVNLYLQKRFNVEYIDTITDAGPNLILSANQNHAAVQSIFEKLNISIDKHHSRGIAIVGHHGCAGNTAAQSDQVRHIKEAIHLLQQKYKNIEIIGLWVDENWQVTELKQCSSSSLSESPSEYIHRGVFFAAAAPLSFVNGCVVWRARLLRAPPSVGFFFEKVSYEDCDGVSWWKCLS